MKLSVITINYNNREGLQKTIESVVNQTWQEFEYIVIDGGSTDGSVDVIKENSSKVSYWVSEPDRGIYHAMNKGIDVAKGEYCIFMNSGDCFYDISTLNDVWTYLDGTSIITGNTLHTDGSLINAPKSVSFLLFYLGTINHQSTFIKTSLLKYYRYDENYKIVSDWKFWLQTLIIDNCSYKIVDTCICLFDITGISLTNHELRMKENDKVLKELFPERVLLDYHNSYDGWENNLYNNMKSSRFNKWLYSFNVIMIKFLSLFRNNWIKKYPLFLK